MKLFHLGLCVAEYPNDGLRNGLLPICSDYRELNCGHATVNDEVLQIIDDFGPDLVFMQIQSANVIFSSVFRYISERALIINWTGDCRDTIPQWMLDVSPYCITAFSNMRDVRSLPGSEYLEIGYDPTIFNPEGEATQVQPIVFFGNHYGNQFPMSQFRYDMVRTLQQRPDFGVYGNYPGANGTFNHSQKAEAAAYRGAKIAINCSHYEIERYSSDRLLRILGTGVFCLCKSYPNMPFVDGVHLRTWNTMEELQDLCDYYLQNVQERGRIAKQGQEFALEHFSYRAMGENVLEIYNKRK